MDYKLESIVEKITSPVICVINGQEKEYSNGKALYEQDFEKYYTLVSLAAKDGKIIVTLKEKDRKAGMPVNWFGEEEASFF